MLDELTFKPHLLEWFEKEQRQMPWRETKNPYYIWISEVMLQQTQVDTVRDYYHRFVEA
ncbi:A/G-specific adenine glycosylase, partial [Staphylococcus pseudintermedius]